MFPADVEAYLPKNSGDTMTQPCGQTVVEASNRALLSALY